MKIHVLMGQRKESYPGEYAPEALACMDECGMSDNPDYMAEKKTHYDATGEFENTVVVPIDVPTLAIMALLRPTVEPIRGQVQR